jgi:hypothetical protein
MTRREGTAAETDGTRMPPKPPAVAGGERFDALFVGAHGADVPLSCPARVRGEVDRGRRVLVLALFEPVGAGGVAERAVSRLGATFAGAGLPAAAERRPPRGPGPRLDRVPEDEETLVAAAHLLADVGPRTQAVNIHAPLGLGSSVDHVLAYEASVRAFASGAGRNLFLYEERPEAFVPGAVRTRLALLGARLPPAGAGVARASLARALWRANDPPGLRQQAGGLRGRLETLWRTRKRWRAARSWNPLRAFGPRLQPIAHAADEETRQLAREIAEMLLPRDRRGRPRAGRRFNKRADAAAKALGAVYHAERLWLLLPSGEGLHEMRHPLDVGE